MNKFFNALLLFFLFPTMALAIFVGFDLPIEILKVSGASLPYRKEAFLVLGLILLIINLRRSIRRWMGMRLITQTSKFKWNVQISKERKQRVIVYTLLEAMVFGFVGSALYQVCSEAFLPAIAFWFATVDNLIFILFGSIRNTFRIGLTSKAIVFSDRDVQLIYFSGLRKVEIHQLSIYFDYIKELQLIIPLDSVPDESKKEFFEAIEASVNKDKVFFQVKN